MSVEENKALVRRFLEAHAKGDLDTLEEMLAPDFVDHSLIPGQQPGREGYLGHSPRIKPPTPTPATSSRSRLLRGTRW